jgi:hypothetical protein
MANQEAVITSECVDQTITNFTQLDESGDKRTMNRMARRLGKEQPALLQFAATFNQEHDDTVGNAAVFYCTLVWAMFEQQFGRALNRLTEENIAAAQEIVTKELEAVDGLADKPVHERYAPALAERQPHVYAKLVELIEEDVREDAMSADCAGIIFAPTQVIVEAFDAATTGRRPGERVGPVVRETPKVGRNEPCPCGSGKKYKKCHGAGE